MDTTQILLITVVTILTILLTVIGIQLVYILREFRRTIEKINKILNDAGNLSSNVTKSFSSFTNVLIGVKTGLSIFSKLFTKDDDKEEKHGR